MTNDGKNNAGVARRQAWSVEEVWHQEVMREVVCSLGEIVIKRPTWEEDHPGLAALMTFRELLRVLDQLAARELVTLDRGRYGGLAVQCPDILRAEAERRAA